MNLAVTSVFNDWHITEALHDTIEVAFISTTCSDILQLGDGIGDRSDCITWSNMEIKALVLLNFYGACGGGSVTEEHLLCMH